MPQRRLSDQLRLVIEAVPSGMLVVDRDGQIVHANALVEQLFGHSRDELVGSPVEMLVPERFRADHPRLRAGFARDPRTRPMGEGREVRGLRKDGTEVAIEIGLNPLHVQDDVFILSSVVDITERKTSELERDRLLGELRALNSELEARVESRTAQLSTTLREREVLLQEIHHRVKNNLQVISSLISMQMRKLEPGPSRLGFEECQRRVRAIALIHEKLYQSKDYARIPFAEYVRSLAGDVFAATEVSLSEITLELSVEDVSLAVDQAIPCGLILNELITNALKHAFPNCRPGTVYVELGKTEAGLLAMRVRDDGVGMPMDLDICEADSLGLKLVCTLAEQLDAQLHVTRKAGTSIALTFAPGKLDP
jgi:PAS domain S-box-containing protein